MKCAKTSTNNSVTIRNFSKLKSSFHHLYQIIFHPWITRKLPLLPFPQKQKNSLSQRTLERDKIIEGAEKKKCPHAIEMIRTIVSPQTSISENDKPRWFGNPSRIRALSPSLFNIHPIFPGHSLSESITRSIAFHREFRWFSSVTRGKERGGWRDTRQELYSPGEDWVIPCHRD